jgi:epoxyqueuosine reductase
MIEGSSGPGPDARSAACMAILRDVFARNARVLEWGVAPARPTPHADLLRSWIAEGRHADMGFMAARLAERLDPQVLHPWAQSAVVFAFPYLHRLGTTSSRYKLAAYAHGDDYHDRARAIYREAENRLRAHPALADVRFYPFADAAPVFERDLASEAGLGWRGKNCCTLNRKHGSAFHLAGFFLDVPLPASAPVEDFCGGCTRCLDQCPTGAFIAPGRLDANKCISYWTIEHRGEVPEALSDRFQGWMFGCDVCQEVCPWNHKHLRAPEEGPAGPEDGAPAFPDSGPAWAALLRKNGGFRRFRSTPLARAGRRSLLRNLAIAARNLGDTSMAGPLGECLGEETDPALLREIGRTLEALGGTIPDGEAPDGETPG